MTEAALWHEAAIDQDDAAILQLERLEDPAPEAGKLPAAGWAGGDRGAHAGDAIVDIAALGDDMGQVERGGIELNVTLDERRAVALLRYAGEEHHRVLASYSEDAVRSWSHPQPVEPSNPNTSLAAVGRPDGSLLVAMNDLEDGRFRLTLDKGAPENVLSLCAEGVEKTGPTTFVIEKRNYSPEADLNVLIAAPIHD